MKKFFLSLKRFNFARELNYKQFQTISCSLIENQCYLSMTLQEEVRNEEFWFDVEAQTIANLRLQIQHPGFMFRDRLAVVNCALVNRLEQELTTIIDGANQCDGFAPMDYPGEQCPISLADLYISHFFSATSYHQLNSITASSEIYQHQQILFCGDDLSVQSNNPNDFLLKTIFLSFCSWRLDEGTPLVDPINFFVKIVLTIYDHELSQYIDIKFNVASLKWIEEQSRNRAAVFLRYILIVEQFDIEVIKRHIYKTVLEMREDDQEGWHGYAVGRLSFGYEIPEFYRQIAKDWDALYSCC